MLYTRVVWDIRNLVHVLYCFNWLFSWNLLLPESFMLSFVGMFLGTLKNHFIDWQWVMIEATLTECLCTVNISADCLLTLGTVMYKANAKVWRDHKASAENLIGADLYAIVILTLFGSIISLLMVRAIKPSDDFDDQVWFFTYIIHTGEYCSRRRLLVSTLLDLQCFWADFIPTNVVLPIPCPSNISLLTIGRRVFICCIGGSS